MCHDVEASAVMCARLPLQTTDNWSDDESFGRQRLIGVDPSLIELCQQLPAQ